MSLGFIGLGNMGGPMAGRLAAAFPDLVVFDRAGTAERAPAGALAAQSAGHVAREAGTVFLSLPDGEAVEAVAGEIATAPGRQARLVVDLSTIGVPAAERAAAALARAGVRYLDAPVSGGVAGAKAGGLAVMAAGSAEDFEAARPALAAMAKSPFHVGTRPGQGQAMKLLNNFLSATAMAATTEAIAFGQAHGLAMKTMLDVLNVSTGRNTATADKFVNRVLTGSFDAGFAAGLMAKDARLYAQGVAEAGTAGELGALVAAIWARVAEAAPEADFTRIFERLGGGRR